MEITSWVIALDRRQPDHGDRPAIDLVEARPSKEKLMARPKRTRGSLMSTVGEDIKPHRGGPVTFMHVLEVPAEQLDTFVAQQRERTAGFP
jgi:hypothetical protein